MKAVPYWMLALGLFLVASLSALLPLVPLSIRYPAGRDFKWEPPSQEAPRVAQREQQHDFGELDLPGEGEHTFTISNIGNAPLRLGKVESSCEDLRCVVHDEEIPAGGKGSVTVGWKPSRGETQVSYTVRLETTDPGCPELILNLHGSVCPLGEAFPGQLSFGAIHPDSPATRSTLIVSKAWEAFSVEVELPDESRQWSWSLQPASPELLAEHGAKSGWQLTVTSPADFPAGEFGEKWRLRLQSVGAETREIPLLLQGRVYRRLGVYGEEIDEHGLINFGLVNSADGAKVRLMLKVRDAETELQLKHVSVTPEFLTARLTRQPTRESVGIYQLDLEVPRGAPPCVFLEPERGKLRLVFDHPRIHDLNLDVRFAVARRP